ncbi:MAG: protein translocase subunit SecD [Magnetococcus sp. WYHC-3]
MRQVPLWKTLLIVVVTILTLLYSLPTLWPGPMTAWMPGEPIQRGLDLQGGLYLLLHVEVDKAVETQADNLVDELRGVLRDKRLRYRGIERSGLDQVVLHLADPGSAAEVEKVLREEINGVDFAADGPAGDLTLTLSEAEARELRRYAVEQAIQTIRSRIDEFGVAEPTIQKQGTERILVQLPGLQDPERAKKLIGRTARLEFKLVDEEGDLPAALEGRVPPGDVVLYGQEKSGSGQPVRQPYLLKKRTVLSGDRLQDARMGFDQQFNQAIVNIDFDRQGARQFARLTGENTHKRMAIVLDDVVYSAPVIQEKIEGGRARITGSFSPEEANDLAIVLRAGALPAPVTIMEERTVGPTMGRDSINQGMLSIAIGGGLVLLFMALYYKGFGVLANVAVVLNVLILIAVLAGLQATLTLPGIAGVVLLVGMSVDANVLIFERIREELRLGKTPLAAIEQGYDRAFLTILDSNLTTLITALLLYQFGTGPVRGFAVTLSIGLIASMFTAIFFTRVLAALILRNRRVQRLSI